MEKSALKLISISCLLFLASFSAKAQFMEDANGRPLFERRYTDVQGSAYLNDNWQKGMVKLANGQIHKNVDLKYDLVAGELIFKSSAGAPLTFVETVKEFTLPANNDITSSGILFRSGYTPVDGAAVNTFYQVLSDGEIQLIKRSYRKVMENKPYNSATTVKTFHNASTYYIVKDGQPVKIKRDKKALLTLLGDHAPEMENFIKANKLNFRSDADVIMLVTFYNSLK